MCDEAVAVNVEEAGARMDYLGEDKKYLMGFSRNNYKLLLVIDWLEPKTMLSATLANC